VALVVLLGLSTEHEGRALAAGLLVDAFSRTAQHGTEIGCRDLLVHAETAQARDFCLDLVLLMKDILRTVPD